VIWRAAGSPASVAVTASHFSDSCQNVTFSRFNVAFCHMEKRNHWHRAVERVARPYFSRRELSPMNTLCCQATKPNLLDRFAEVRYHKAATQLASSVYKTSA